MTPVDPPYEAVCNRPGCFEEQIEDSLYCGEHTDNTPVLEDQPEQDVTDADIRHATIPNAAALLRRAKAKGYVTATSAYAGVA